MQRKLNDEFIREYSEEFSEKITTDFFADKDLISGKEILNVTPSKQVNFFVLKILFRKWQEEMKRLESPFFNYRNPEVRKAMVQFMNTLSQHIEVKRDLFASMVEEAVADTLLLAVDPGSYISLEFEEMDVTNVTEKMTKPIFKYLKLHKSEIEEFFAENNGAELDEFVENAEEFFLDVNVDATVKQQVDLLSQIVPLSVDEVYFREEDLIDLDNEEKIPSASEELDEDDQEVSFDHDEEDSYDEETFEDDDESDREIEEENEDFEEKDEVEELDDSDFESDLDEDDLPEEIDESEADDESGLDEVESEPEESEDEFAIEEPDEEPESNQDDLSDEEEEYDEDDDQDEPDEHDKADDENDSDSEPVNEHFAPIQKTVNEKFGEGENPTLADKLEQKKVGTIMEAISVNHRYMFTKELFDGDREAFVTAIEKIEQCDSFDDAVEVLVQNYATKLGWDMNSDEVKELLKVIFRKYR